MKMLNQAATLNEIEATAALLGLTVEINDDGIYSLFNTADKWVGGGLEEGLIGELNAMITDQNEQAETEAAAAAYKAEKMKDFTEAAIINAHGEVVAACRTDVKSGDYVKVAGDWTQEGEPVNVRMLKVLRSKQALRKAGLSDTFATATLYRDEWFYQL